jgi:DNA-binding response OmpR family regulator
VNPAALPGPVEGTRPVQILLVDDEPMLTEMLSIALRYEGFEITIAHTGLAALEQERAVRPDLVILDVMLPGMDGMDVCRRLRQQSGVAILMLTARGDVEDRIRGLESGADDYLAKPFTFRELVARLHAILRRRGVDMAGVVQAGNIMLDRRSRRVTQGGQVVDLTPREFEMLDLFLSHPRQVFSREVILNRIWGYEYAGDANLIDVHISHLRDKLGDADRRLIRSVRGIGYGIEVPDETA